MKSMDREYELLDDIYEGYALDKRLKDYEQVLCYFDSIKFKIE